MTGANFRNWGLSPRVRGNPSRHRYFVSRSGPIPACAGQPFFALEAPKGLGAYPRVCGATRQLKYANYYGPGLSPRVRGNLFHTGTLMPLSGPIPACAGQTDLLRESPRDFRAYPRVCGATVFGLAWSNSRGGLSPRVRGNPTQEVRALADYGPIPACAGQPIGVPNERTPLGAYPRVCGATRCAQLVAPSLQGLSPRVRGNPTLAKDYGTSAGPIPACAGQPIELVAGPYF